MSLNTHLYPIALLLVGRGTKGHVSFLCNANSSSLIAAFQWSCAELHILFVGSLLTIKALGLCIPDLDLIRMPCLFVGMAGRLTGGASVKDTLVLVHGETQVLGVH